MGNLNTTLLGVYNNIHAIMQTFWFEHSGVYIYTFFQYFEVHNTKKIKWQQIRIEQLR